MVSHTELDRLINGERRVPVNPNDDHVEPIPVPVHIRDDEDAEDFQNLAFVEARLYALAAQARRIPCLDSVGAVNDAWVKIHKRIDFLLTKREALLRGTL